MDRCPFQSFHEPKVCSHGTGVSRQIRSKGRPFKETVRFTANDRPVSEFTWPRLFMLMVMRIALTVMSIYAIFYCRLELYNSGLSIKLTISNYS